MKILYILLLPFLFLLSWLYGLIIWLRNYFFYIGLFKCQEFDKPIISIGNITMGGTGKTPMVIYLANYLKKNGNKPGIISRGYGRDSKGLITVHDGNNLLATVDISGDEPYLMARILDNVPVVVCENRCRGIKQLLNNYSVDVIIMDDGFQHRQVNRDLDIIAISAYEKQKDYELIPLGNLREPIKNIKRADLVIYTKTENYKIPAIHSKIKHNLSGNIINSFMQFVLMKYDDSGYHKVQPPDNYFFAFCGISDPRSFINYASKLGLKIKDERFYKDHQNYTQTIIEQLSEQIKRNACNHVLTTEKDIVKLPDSFLDEFEVYIIKIDIVFENESIIQDMVQPLLFN